MITSTAHAMVREALHRYIRGSVITLDSMVLLTGLARDFLVHELDGLCSGPWPLLNRERARSATGRPIWRLRSKAIVTRAALLDRRTHVARIALASALARAGSNS
jgi:hypothetical protein